VARLCGPLNDVKTAFTRVIPHAQEETASAARDLRQRWSYQGEGLLSGVLRWTEPGLLVEEGAVLMVHPVLGGGGTAHLPYNSVRMEAVGADPVAELPEVLRLAWLLSSLNLDLPRYSEHLRPRRLTQVACLAMIPVVLSAAELGLDGSLEARLPQATALWMGPAEKATAGILSAWWDSYRTLRPAWATALQALDQLLP
jgi:hypothetical protein